LIRMSIPRMRGKESKGHNKRLIGELFISTFQKLHGIILIASCGMNGSWVAWIPMPSIIFLKMVVMMLDSAGIPCMPFSFLFPRKESKESERKKMGAKFLDMFPEK
jgi:hypothetical protein